MADNKEKKTNINGWDAWQAEMMKQSIADYIPIASGIRCLYDALRAERFTAYQALELCKTFLTTLLSNEKEAKNGN